MCCIEIKREGKDSTHVYLATLYKRARALSTPENRGLLFLFVAAGDARRSCEPNFGICPFLVNALVRGSETLKTLEEVYYLHSLRISPAIEEREEEKKERKP